MQWKSVHECMIYFHTRLHCYIDIVSCVSQYVQCGVEVRETSLATGNIKILDLRLTILITHLDIDGSGNISLMVYFYVEISRKTDQPSN